MRATRWLLLLAAVTLDLSPAVAQTQDEARLIIGISGGYRTAADLWSVPNQPVLSTFEQGPTIYALRRRVQSDITLSGSGTYYRGPHLGIVGEFTYLGLGTEDGCAIVQDNGDSFLEDACAVLQGQQRSASAVSVQTGLVLRPWARARLQPYVKGLAGLAFTPSSPITTVATTGYVGDTAVNLTVYQDEGWKELRPTWTLGAGLSTAPSSGFQLHVEVRRSWLPLSQITSATAGQGYVPPTRRAVTGFTSVLVGFDIVLERRRGRRY